ncbi:transposase domain-containing protein [Streptomyces sp. NPDC004721]
MTQIIDSELVDADVEDTGARERRRRLLPTRVVVYFVLALAFFERSSYLAVWEKLTAGLGPLAVARPSASSLARARRRLGSAPLRRLFTVLAGPVADRGQCGTFYQGLRLVAIDGTTLSAPDEETVTWHYRKHIGTLRSFGYPLVRLVAIVECGTRALLDAAFGPDHVGELAYARSLLGYRRMEVRLVEAWITVTLADGTQRTELWRLLTNLLDAQRYPAEQLLEIYHRRWQAESCYFSLKSTILDGRVLRSRSVPGLEQEIFALLTVYQALIRMAGRCHDCPPGPARRAAEIRCALPGRRRPDHRRTRLPRGRARVSDRGHRTCSTGQLAARMPPLPCQSPLSQVRKDDGLDNGRPAKSNGVAAMWCSRSCR